MTIRSCATASARRPCTSSATHALETRAECTLPAGPGSPTAANAAAAAELDAGRHRRSRADRRARATRAARRSRTDGQCTLHVFLEVVVHGGVAVDGGDGDGGGGGGGGGGGEGDRTDAAWVVVVVVGREMREAPAPTCSCRRADASAALLRRDADARAAAGFDGRAQEVRSGAASSVMQPRLARALRRRSSVTHSSPSGT